MPRPPSSAKGPRNSACLLLWVAFVAISSKSAAAAPIKVACIGEHTTHSHAFPADNREAQPVGNQEYPAQLQALLGPGYDVRNFGDCCASVLQGYTVSETHPYVAGTNAGDGVGYKESIAFLPDVVIIGSWGRHDWGMNKAPGEVFTLQGFQDGYDDLVKRYQALSSHPKIFVSLPIPILNGQGDVPDEGVKTSDVLPVVKTIAAQYKLPIVDMYTPFLNHMELFKQPPDPKGEGEGEHVTPSGITAMANAAYAALQKDASESAGGSGGASAGNGVGGSAGNGGSSGDTGGIASSSAGLGGASGASDFGAGSAGLLSAGGTSGAGTAGQLDSGGQSGASVAQSQAGAGTASPPPVAAKSGCSCSLVGRPGESSRLAWLLGCFAWLGARRRARSISERV
jgi:hypothetical protein